MQLTHFREELLAVDWEIASGISHIDPERTFALLVFVSSLSRGLTDTQQRR